MGLTIVTGGANAGKTGALHAAVRDAAAVGRRPLLLLPSAPEVARAEDEFSRGVASLGVQIEQFDQYLGSLWGLVGDGREIVRPTQRLLLINNVVTHANLQLLARSAGRPGFARLVEGLVQRAGETLALDSVRARRAHHPLAAEMLHLVDAYADILRESGLVEPTEAATRLAEIVTRDVLPDVLAVNRFASFTDPQRRFIERCAELGCETYVALTWLLGHPATAGADDTFARLSRIPGAVHVVASAPADEDPELHALAQFMFVTGEESRGIKPSGSVALSEAAGASGEASRIARDVQELEISGIPRQEIAVVYRAPERHLSRLIAAFRETGIEADLDARVPVTRSGLGRAMTLLLNYLCAGHSRSDLMGFLRSGYSWAEPGLVDAADERLRLERVVSGPKVHACATSVGSKTRLLLERASHLVAAPIDARAVDGWRWLVADMLRSSHALGAVRDERDLIDAAVQRTIMSIIEEIVSVGVGEWACQDLLGVLESAEVAIAPGRTKAGHVQVMSAERARSRRFSAVILGGLNAGEFPALPPEDALSAPELAAELLAAGIDTAARVDADAERLLFYQVATGARKRLILSRMVCDDDGRVTRPSPLWEEFLDLYRDPVSGEPYGAELPIRRLELGDLAEAEDAPRAERRRLRGMAASGLPDDPRVRHAIRRSQARPNCLGGGLTAELAALDTFSATEIEAYLACPFKWFYDSKLRPERIDREIDALEKGTLAHAILQGFYEAREADGLGRVTPSNVGEALRQHASVAESTLAKSPRPTSLRDEETLHSAVVGSRRIVERDAVFLPEFAPIAHELQFNTKNDTPTVRIGSFFLKGRIDRIDANDDGLIVIDYKSGSSVAKKADFEKRGLVQLPLYGLVASRRFDRPLLGGVYRSMQRGGDRGFVSQDAVAAGGLVSTDACDEQEIETIVAEAIERAERAVDGIRSGMIPQKPRDKDACMFCGAAAICGRSGR